MTATVAAVDIGATSGRVMVGTVGPGTLDVRHVARFPNGPVRLADGLHWDSSALYASVLAGLAQAARADSGIASIGIDAWAVDYALMQGSRALAEPFHYRDHRTATGAEAVHRVIPFPVLYRRNGLQFLPFNTVYQLAADDPAVLRVADRMLLIPDLIAFHLTGVAVAERTNASTTGLLDVTTRQWDTELMGLLGLDSSLLCPLVDAGSVTGGLLGAASGTTTLPTATHVVAVGSHDTASAVVAAPLRETGGAYISCGTWGLVGVETERPIVTDAAREANFTNEGGVDGRTRFLHNVMGLWLLNESVATWRGEGATVDLERLLAEAAALGPHVPLFDANDAVFMAPGDIPSRIATWCTRAGIRPPTTPAEVTRSIIESLAQAFADAVATAGHLSGQRIDRIHMVGGGALNELLCQRTADRSGLPVEAGPVEATAIGNVLVQGRALGAIGGTLESMRDLVGTTMPPRVYQPRGVA